jgi:NitT/TauT family transport system substrate-binding protein
MSSMRRSSLAAAAALLVLAGCADRGSGAPSQGSSPGTKKVTLTLNWVPYGEHAPFYYGVEKGFYAAEGIDLQIKPGGGSGKTVQAVDAGQAEFGWADTPPLLKGIATGMKVKSLGVFLQKGPSSVEFFADKGITKPADLKGKTVTVMSFQDTTYYALLGVLASVGLTQNDVDIQAAGPTGVWEFVAAGKAAGMAGVPDWIPPIQAAGVKVKVIPSDEFFPHMAQGIAVSDDVIKQKPEMVRKFVRAALRGMKDIMDNPDSAADDFVKFVPEWKGKEGAVKFALNMYAKLVYPGQKTLGEVDVARLSSLQDFYVSKGLIQKASPVDDLYSNAFVK